MAGELVGARVFLKRKALMLLRSYWCRRWDHLPLRELLSRPRMHRLHVEAEALDGQYLRLRWLDMVWFRGLFTVGRHLPSGLWYRDPIHAPLSGLGPRALVFPGAAARLEEVTLLGDWSRYQRCAEGWITPERPIVRALPPGEGPRVELRVERVTFELPAPLISRWGERTFHQPTVVLHGRTRDRVLAEHPLAVPVSEVYWRAFG